MEVGRGRAGVVLRHLLSRSRHLRQAETLSRSAEGSTPNSYPL